MSKAQSAIATLVLLAGVVNAFGAVKKSKDITYPVVGGFVVLILLLALAEANARVAEMFAGAYMVTCMLTNGQELFTGITTALTSGLRFDPGPQGGATGQSAPTASYSTPTVQRATPTPVIRSV